LHGGRGRDCQLAGGHGLHVSVDSLLGAEHRLGLVSPFNAGGYAIVVPVNHVNSLKGC